MSKLAINGGTPVRDTFIPYAQHWVEGSDIDAVADAMRSSHLTQGKIVSQYENAFAEYHGAKFGIATNSGTGALEIAYMALKMFRKYTTYVIGMNPLTFVATASSALKAGFEVEFVDELPNRDYVGNQEKYVPMDYSGCPDEYPSFIRDSAHSIGMPTTGNSVIYCYSTHASKNITTGEGGMILTNDSEIAKYCRMICDHGRDATGNALYIGSNYRLPEINAALGLSQLQKLPYFIDSRRGIASMYHSGLSECDLLSVPKTNFDDSSWHLYVVELALDNLRTNRDIVMQALHAENIGTQIHYKPVYYHTAWQNMGYKYGSCPESEAKYERILSLPMFPKMTDDDVQSVIDGVIKVLENYRS